MALKKKISTYKAILTVIVILSISFAAHAKNYVLKREKNGAILLEFNQKWSFNHIRLPVAWSDGWGKDVICLAAVIQVDNQRFIAAAGNSSFIDFNMSSVTGNMLKLTPLKFEKPGTDSNFSQPQFAAVAAHIKAIEIDLEKHIDATLSFNNDNNCFSCHTALPLSIACREAAVRGYNINREKVARLAESVQKLQKPNGTFFFPDHPDYGVITTSLCAGAIMANLFDIAPDSLNSIQNIFYNFPVWLDQNGIIKSDFYFRPVFIGQKTSALFESIIISTLHNNIADKGFIQNMKQRIMRMQHWARNFNDSPIHRRIILLTGIPHLMKLTSEKRETLNMELEHLLLNEPEGRRNDVRALTMLIMQKVSTEKTFNLPAARINSPADEIWNCLERILNNLPTKANKNIISVDITE